MEPRRAEKAGWGWDCGRGKDGGRGVTLTKRGENAGVGSSGRPTGTVGTLGPAQLPHGLVISARHLREDVRVCVWFHRLF